MVADQSLHDGHVLIYNEFHSQLASLLTKTPFPSPHTHTYTHSTLLTAGGASGGGREGVGG